MWTKLLPAALGAAPCPSRTTRRSSAAVANLPSLALPPITGLLVLLLGYIILVGPVNYLILSRLDRREWAWITVPVADRRVHDRRVRHRGAAARLGRHRPPGRDRPRRAGHRPGDGPDVPRHLQPHARDLPAARRRRLPARHADERRRVRRRHRRRPRRARGHAVARPRPRGRVRLAAHGPGGGQRHGPRSWRRRSSCRTAGSTAPSPTARTGRSSRRRSSLGSAAAKLEDIPAGATVDVRLAGHDQPATSASRCRRRSSAR